MSTSTAYIKKDEQDKSELKKSALSDLKSTVYLLRSAKPFALQISFGLILIFVSTFFELYSAKLFGFMIEDGVLKKDVNYTIKLASFIIIIQVFSLLVIWLGRRTITKYASKTLLNIRNEMFNKMQLLPLKYYDTQPQGRVVTRMTHDIEGIENFFTGSLGRVIQTVFYSIVSIIMMYLASPKLCIIVVLTIVPGVFLVFFTKTKVRNLNREMSKTNSSLNSMFTELINGLLVLRSFGLESWAKESFDGHNKENINAHLDANKFYSFLRPSISFFCTLPVVVFIYFGGKEVMAGAMGIGLFIAFIRYIERFQNPIMSLARELHVIQQAFTSTERVASVLKELVEDDIFSGDGDITSLKKSNISFNNIFMAYKDENYILKDLSFDIFEGEKIGLVGRTGCGKTSTVSLLMRLYDFQKGEIKIGGISINKYKRETLRSEIGFVSQDVIIFKGNLRENLDLNTSLSDEEILDSCKKTGLFKVMKDSELNLDSNLFDGGSNLSVGEKQLISITRVLLSDPKILILDEATANIDPYYESLIQKGISSIMKNKTCLIIAHRLDTLDICDRIFVFDAGSLVESGSLEELREKNGYFHKLQDSQF